MDLLKLYELDKELILAMQMWEEWATDHDGDVTDFPLNDYLEKLEGTIEHKALGLACAIRIETEETKKIDELRKAIAKSLQVQKNKVDRMKDFLCHFVTPGQKYKDHRVTIGWRKSEGVVIGDGVAVPKEFIKDVKPQPMLTELKAALKGGLKIEGIFIEQRQNLSIR